MADVASHLRATLEALRADDTLAPGQPWCRRWTEAVDDGLRTLLGDVELRSGRVAIAATGGYGRGELCPGSDIDLLVLTQDLEEDTVAAVVQAIVYPLWDAGLTVGYATRSVSTATRMTDDIDTATATLDARFVGGSAELVRSVRDGVLERLQRKPWRFVSALADADEERRRRAGDLAEVLEPHLKDGAGGLRDVQSLRWAAGALLGERELDALVTTRYLSAPDRSRLARAYDRLLSIRVALHLVAGRKEDRLGFDLQDDVAARLSAHDASDPASGADLLHEVFLAARTVDHVHRAAWSLISADAVRERSARRWFSRPTDRRFDTGFVESDGVLTLGDARPSSRTFPVDLLEALARSGTPLDRGAAARVRSFMAAAGPETILDTWAWSDDSRRRFVDILWMGSGAFDAIAEFDDLGLLAALLPGWGPLSARPQRNPYHRFSLDRHAVHAALTLGDLAANQPWATARLEDVTDRDGLMLGVLLHDVGKAYGEPHSERGIPVAESIVRSMGFDAETVALVGRLVRLHLLLPETATRRDLADPRLVGEVAAEIGDRQTLACLHLLAAADGRATGPSAWTSWKDQLVSQLVTKVDRVMEDRPEEESPDLAAAAEARDVAAALGTGPDVVDAHLGVLPDRYAASVSPRAIVRHAIMAEEPLDWTEVRTRVTTGAEGAIVDDLDLVAMNRPGLFAKVAGVLALHGGSILSAYAFTRSDDVVVDTFHVRRPDETREEVGGRPGSWWAAVEGDLVEAVAGRLALRARVSRKLTSVRRRPRPGPDVETRVAVGPDTSGRSSVVEVHAPDDIGVLYRILDALAELELDVVTAKIDTVGNEVIDVFYVRDADGAPLDDDHAEEVVLAVEHALAG